MKVYEKIVNGYGFKTIDRVKTCKFPILLWGRGDVAGVIYDYLIKEGIVIFGVVLDKNDDAGEWRGMPVYSFESKELPERYSVIVGHSHYELADDLQKRIPQIEDVFCFTAVLFDRSYNIPKEYIFEHGAEYEEAYELMADRLSQDSYIAYLNALVSDDYRYVLPYVCREMDYFQNDIWQIGQDEVYVDCGAYDGDTIRTFLNRCENNYGSVYAFELDKANFGRLEKYVESKKLTNIKCENIGLWDKVGVLRFCSSVEQEARIDSSEDSDGNVIPVTTLDTYFVDELVNIIKINYTPGAIETLYGARNVIRRSKPKLAVTVGLDADEICSVPRIIHEIDSSYDIYLRFFTAMPAKLVLLAQAGDKCGCKG